MELNERQSDILEAAEVLFATKGFVGTSVRDIAANAGVNVAMISYYFGSKEKLLQTLLLNRTKQSRALLSNLKQDINMDPREKIKRIIDFYVDQLLRNRRFHTIMSRQMSLVQDEEIKQLLIDIKRTNIATIQEIIKEGQRKKVFRKVDITLTIGSLIGTIYQVSMSKPFYEQMLRLHYKDEEDYFKKLSPKLKAHLKSLMLNHLELKD